MFSDFKTSLWSSDDHASRSICLKAAEAVQRHAIDKAIPVECYKWQEVRDPFG
jgi:hypothetical protein